MGRFDRIGTLVLDGAGRCRTCPLRPDASEEIVHPLRIASYVVWLEQVRRVLFVISSSSIDGPKILSHVAVSTVD